MDHHFRVGATGDASRDSRTSTTSAAGPTASTFRASATSAASKRDYLRGFGYQGSAGRARLGRGIAELGVRRGVQGRSCASPGRWFIELDGFGEMPARITRTA